MLLKDKLKPYRLLLASQFISWLSHRGGGN